jgi:hypothetical protein
MDRVWDAASTLACGPTWVPTGLPMHPILRAAPMIDMGQSVHFASACAPILGADGWIFPLRSAILEESSRPCRWCGYESGAELWIAM